MSSKRTRFPITALTTVIALSSAAFGVGLTPGNLVVVRIGDGAAALSNASTAVFLDEYTTAGAAVGTLPMPVAASGANKQLTNSGSATSEGYITLSANGQYLTLAGYASNPGVTGIAATASATVNRVVGRVTITDSTIDTTTAGTWFDANNVRSATTDDGTRVWASGVGTPSTTGGVRYALLGAATSDQVTTSVTNTRVVNFFNGQLYVSSASGAFVGISHVGSGIPNSGFPVTTTLLPGFPSTGSPSPYDFYLADANTLYVADDRTVATGGGIEKFTLSGGTWSLAYTINGGLTTGVRGLTGTTSSNGPTVLYATTTQTTNNAVVTVTDTGASSMATPVVTGAGTNKVFRGLRLVPAAVAPPACPADFDGSHTVNGLDLAQLLGQWTGSVAYKPCPPYRSQDLNQDCKVNGLDLALLLGAWGPCP